MANQTRTVQGQMPARRGVVALLVLVTTGVLVAGCKPAKSAPAPAPTYSADSTIDVLLGRNGRQQLNETLRKRSYDGRTFDWDQYVAWGRELVTTAQVKNPPIGRGPSPRLSDYYRCVHCHNVAREDALLTAQDPEAREKLIRETAAGDPGKRDGSVLSMTPGTTLWGAVNRQRFYNGHYTRYHKLRVADGNRMDPEKLADAVQVCCRYCSTGRFPEQWELDSILAYLWELELRLKDLNLPEAAERQVLEQLQGGDARVSEGARKVIRDSYLRSAGATLAELPKAVDGDRTLYADGTSQLGDATNGKLLYRSACTGCHGGDVNMFEGATLARNPERFHDYVLRGTERDDLYMPLFTSERLSHRQTADIRAHLRSLNQTKP